MDKKVSGLDAVDKLTAADIRYVIQDGTPMKTTERESTRTREDDVNRQVLTGDIALTSNSPVLQFLGPNGTDRIVDLPSSPRKCDHFIFKNIGGANLITVKFLGTTLFALPPGNSGEAFYDGIDFQSI